MSRPRVDQLVRGLRGWVRNHDLNVQAAVELLISHDVWLRRTDLGFAGRCVQPTSDGHYCIDWRAARAAFEAGEFTCASTTERAVLDVAIALGEDRYRFTHMGTANAQLLIEATTRALGGRR